MSEKIKAEHLARKAVLYIRQSSTFQVIHNEESRRLQYAMTQRIRSLGWQEVSVIDEDLGRSASGAVEHQPFTLSAQDGLPCRGLLFGSRVPSYPQSPCR
jgi:hypothetical protein